MMKRRIPRSNELNDLDTRSAAVKEESHAHLPMERENGMVIAPQAWEGFLGRREWISTRWKSQNSRSM